MNEIHFNLRPFIYTSYKNILITNINLKIIKYLEKQKYCEVEKIIEENLKDKFDLTFGHFGSYFTECSIEGSDIDICIIYKPKDNDYFDFGNILYQFLYNQKYLIFKSIDKIKNLITLDFDFDIKDKLIKDVILNNYGNINVGELTEIKIDIKFDKDIKFLEDCEKSVEYIKKALKKYKEIKPVFLFLKRYFKKIGKNKIFFGGISSYSLFLLVLNTIKCLKKNKNLKINEDLVLLSVLGKFSKFDFGIKGINKDNYDYYLENDNIDKTPYILNPITGYNVAGNGRLKGPELNQIFLEAFNLYKDKNDII